MLTIKQGEITEGFPHWELSEGDKVLLSGMGNDPVEALLDMLILLTENGGDGPVGRRSPSETALKAASSRVVGEPAVVVLVDGRVRRPGAAVPAAR